MFILSLLFFVTAILYSSVGFGGGSTYLALLLIWDIPYYIIPVIALFCNIIVVSGNSINYIKAGNLNHKLLIPYLIGSVPFSFIGGSISLEKEIFEIILFFVLSIAGVLLLINSNSYKEDSLKLRDIPKIFSILIGSILGLVSGIVGIGGGIFLSPILFLLKAGHPKQIATTASLFILINSISGIFGQFTKQNILNDIFDYWILFLVVLLGGQIGNFLNLKFLSNKLLTIITSGLVIFVAIRIGSKILS
ncbi:sulfite exporter TauE/SafE family protein [Candidatus Pelagibacter communis]|uniref:sulfite exporter TauE/SafE family protein n=1 Tax=Pelagibacter ubique TaxID=198252 RepID=UPI00094DD825|nr:sulfite exporter TauE/SafE family protein [Candidatus Pelagibacter ubique]